MGEYASRRAEHREMERRWAEEKVRVLRQRAVFKAIPETPEKLAAEIAMLKRAWELLDEGEAGCVAADALLEFVADWRAQKLFDEFFETRNEWDARIYGGSACVEEPVAVPNEIRQLPAEEHKHAILTMWASGKTVAAIRSELRIGYNQAYAIIQRERLAGNPLAARRQWGAPTLVTSNG